MSRSVDGREEMLRSVTKCLQNVSNFVQDSSKLANTHSVNFIVDDTWSSLLTTDTRQALLDLSEDDLILLPDANSFLSGRKCEHNEGGENLVRHLEQAAATTLPALGMCSSVSDVADQLNLTLNQCDKVVLTGEMCEKKMHEVREMAHLVAAMARAFNINQVIDVGSGLGYLGTMLNISYGLRVTGVECRQELSESAERKRHKLRNQWTTYLRQRKLDGSANLSAPHCDSGYKLVNHAVTSGSKLSDMMVSDGDNGGLVDDPSSGLLVCGLHTCGALSPNIISMFLEDHTARLLCHVPCCYHALNERYPVSTQLTQHQHREKQYDYEVGFPMSTYLKERRYELGRNARMLSLQSVERSVRERRLPSESLYYRALLQVILHDHLPSAQFEEGRASGKFTVGRIYGKIARGNDTANSAGHFVEYVRQCLALLGLDDVNASLRDADIQGYAEEYEVGAWRERLSRFTQYRFTLAASIEALLLLDRLCYLLEQECVRSAHIVRMFDANISPRCYGIIAVKH